MIITRKYLDELGYVCVYRVQGRLGLSDRAGLYEAFPSLFLELNDGVYCKLAGETLHAAVSAAVATLDEVHQIKDAKRLLAQREIVIAIAQEFSENAVCALVDSMGRDAATTTIAERALSRMNTNRRKKPGERDE